ncbi:MAG TPA: hypothetical protein VMV86_01385 [Methanosarcinales archaeon]|nr:hypothetical protein [Methanosarcinales archaeon]
MSSFRFGSHLPVLMKVMQLSKGPVLELGSGLYSTVYLHWACFNNKRKLTTIESNRNYYKSVKKLRCDWHEIVRVKKWEEAQSHYKKDWSVVLLDQGPGIERGISAKYLTHADYVVLHDSELPQGYGYEDIYPLYKYRFDYINPEKNTPFTTVLSNKYDLTDLLVRAK